LDDKFGLRRGSQAERWWQRQDGRQLVIVVTLFVRHDIDDDYALCLWSLDRLNVTKTSSLVLDERKERTRAKREGKGKAAAAPPRPLQGFVLGKWLVAKEDKSVRLILTADSVHK